MFTGLLVVIVLLNQVYVYHTLLINSVSFVLVTYGMILRAFGNDIPKDQILYIITVSFMNFGACFGIYYILTAIGNLKRLTFHVMESMRTEVTIIK